MSITIDEVKDRVRSTLNAEHGNSNSSHSQIAITFPALPDGASHWMIYRAGDIAPFAGLSPSIPGNPEAFPEWYINPHSWLTDLRSLARMLEGELELPHEPRYSGNAAQRRKQRRADERGETRNTYRCRVCLEAFKRRRSYQDNKLLLKET